MAEEGIKCPICGGDIVVDPATGKKLCANCGSEYTKQESTIKETDKKCPNCGATMSGKKSCPKCGAELEENQKFCGKCGNKLAE